jgi:prolipoprotein diacylglyceryltransferase
LSKRGYPHGPATILAQAIRQLGNYFSQALYGRPAALDYR